MNAIKRFILRSKMGRAYASNDLAKASFYATEYLRNNEGDEGALWLLLDISFRKKDYKEAEEYASRLLLRRSDHQEALQKMSMICYEKEDYEAAYSFVRRVLDRSGSSTEIDRLLNDLESSNVFSGLARNVRHTVGYERLEDKEWLEWALKFKRWYEENDK